MSWLSDRWGRGPSLNGLKSSVKGTIRTVGKAAPYIAGAALIPGVGGALGGAIGGALGKIPGVGGMLSGGGADGQGNFGALGDLAGKAGGAIRGVGGSGGDGKGFGLGDLLGLGLGAWSGVEGIQAQHKSDDLLKQAMAGAQGEYASRAPLREAAMSRMLNPQRPDLAGLADDPGNPYAAPMAAKLRAVRKSA